MSTNRILFRRLNEDAKIPTKATMGAAGFDLYALEDTHIAGGSGMVKVPTGISVRLPEGTYGRIAIRSGLASEEHLCISGGVIDRDYKGEIKVLVFCVKTIDGGHTYWIKKGERFAQLVVEKIHDEAAECPLGEDYGADQSMIGGSSHEHAGFGSTGKY